MGKKDHWWVVDYEFKQTPKQKQTGNYGVQVRRGGVFRNIATTSDLNKAISIGRERVSSTLGATYRITGAKGLNLRTPAGFYSKSSKGGTLFIEKRKYRLSKTGEKVEIKAAKRRKKKKK